MIILVYSVTLWFGSSPLLTIFVAVCCSEVQCVAASCSVLQQVAVCCSELQCVVLCSRCVFEHLLLRAVLRVRTLYIYTHRDISIHTHTRCAYEHAKYTYIIACNIATHCNTLQHTAMHCNTLQHTPNICDMYISDTLLRA